MAYEYSKIFGLNFECLMGASNLAAISLTDAFVYETGGRTIVCRFVAPVSQTNVTLTVYAWVTAVVGSPTDVRAAVYNGPVSGDPDRPEAGGSALATSGATDLSAAAGSWVAFTISGVSLTQNATYFVIIDNRTGTPADNYPTIAYQGTLEMGASTDYLYARTFRGGYNINGFTADPVFSSGAGCFVLKFNDGTLLGMPYVGSGSHADNANDRGIRLKFSEDVVVSGIFWSWSGTAVTGVAIYKTDGTDVALAATDFYEKQRGLTARFTPVTLEGGVEYDIVITYTSAATTASIMNMGEASPPADVQNCRFPSFAYVDGDTPGSYTVDNLSIMRVGLIIDNNPAIAAGGGDGATDYAFI